MALRVPGRAISLVALALAAVVTALVVATVATSSLLGTPRTQTNSLKRRATHHLVRRSRISVPAIPQWLSTTLLLLLLIAIIALVWFTKIRRRETVERLHFEDVEPSPLGDWGVVILAQLGDAATNELHSLRKGDARNAIVACWMHFQEATAQAGIQAHEADTSTEFTVRVLRLLQLDGPAVDTLSALYREARFSEHDMGESARTSAIEAVGALAAQLTSLEASAAISSRPTSTLDSVAT